MSFPPGSFSKNFAWDEYGPGMRRLHDAIRRGFQGRLLAPGRDDFRALCGVNDPNLDLIPVNFFLHNTVANGENFVSVDELVFQAITQPHTTQFDRLALFAFHLNMAGVRAGRNGEPQPAPWAKEFVVQRLWYNGGWRSDQLETASMDDFILPLLRAEPKSQIKCRANYRHMFEMCGFLPAGTAYINTGYEHWIASAAFLALDRLLLDNPVARNAGFVDLSRWLGRQDLFRLIGVPAASLDVSFTRRLASEYLRLGGLDRFTVAGLPALVEPRTPEEAEAQGYQQREEAEFGAEGALPTIPDLLLQEREEQSQAQRRFMSYHALARSRRNAVLLKHLYANSCMFCGQRLQVGTNPERYYSEGAHVKPLGAPHNGPDIMGNMLILCPNHHLQFDNGLISIRRSGNGYAARSKILGDPLEGRRIQVRHPHRLRDELVDWHHRFWFGVA